MSGAKSNGHVEGVKRQGILWNKKVADLLDVCPLANPDYVGGFTNGFTHLLHKPQGWALVTADPTELRGLTEVPMTPEELNKFKKTLDPATRMALLSLPDVVHVGLFPPNEDYSALTLCRKGSVVIKFPEVPGFPIVTKERLFKKTPGTIAICLLNYGSVTQSLVPGAVIYGGEVPDGCLQNQYDDPNDPAAKKALDVIVNRQETIRRAAAEKKAAEEIALGGALPAKMPPSDPVADPATELENLRQQLLDNEKQLREHAKNHEKQLLKKAEEAEESALLQLLYGGSVPMKHPVYLPAMPKKEAEARTLPNVSTHWAISQTTISNKVLAWLLEGTPPAVMSTEELQAIEYYLWTLHLQRNKKRTHDCSASDYEGPLKELRGLIVEVWKQRKPDSDGVPNALLYGYAQLVRYAALQEPELQGVNKVFNVMMVVFKKKLNKLMESTNPKVSELGFFVMKPKEASPDA